MSVAVVVGATLAGPMDQAAAYNRHRGPVPNVVAGAGGDGKFAESDISVVENLGKIVPGDLAFADFQGRKVPLSSFLGQGKPVLMTMGYYHCPQLCNLVHEGLVKGLKASGLTLGKDFLGIAVSVDPNEDPKSANTNQRRLHRALGNTDAVHWPFLMGDKAQPEAARKLADAVGFRYFYDAASKQFAHAAVAFLLSPEGKITRYLYGVDFPARDLRLAVVEAGGGRVGTTLDRVLLTCFKYDPMTQRYTPFVAGFVRIGAGLSAVALFGLLAVLWRKELLVRRRRTA